jgi:hypothetical protein
MVGERFFDVDVLTDLERRDRHIVMQVLRRHDMTASMDLSANNSR